MPRSQTRGDTRPIRSSPKVIDGRDLPRLTSSLHASAILYQSEKSRTDLSEIQHLQWGQSEGATSTGMARRGNRETGGTLPGQAPSRGMSDRQLDTIHHRDAPLAGEPEQERGGAAMGTEVPWVQPHGRLQFEAAARAADGAAVPAASVETDATDSGREQRADG